jgi:MHS family proline/betaine transporter-like MFS transporter
LFPFICKKIDVKEVVMKNDPRTANRIFTFALVSNILEWYEFSVYGYLVFIIADLFFNSGSSALNAIFAFLAFSTSYFVRPLGAAFFGYMSDKRSRITSLQISTLVMSVPTFLIGILPTYSSVGVLSTLLLIVLRVTQGFAAGGEFPSSACLVYESFSEKRRGFFCSGVSLSSLLGVMFGSLTVAILHICIDDNTMREWGWRIPFLLGLPITIAIYMSRRLLTIVDIENNKENITGLSIRESLFSVKYKIVRAIILVGFMHTSFFLLFVWMSSYQILFLQLDASSVNIANTIGLLFLGFSILLFGYVSRFFSVKTIMSFSCISLLMVCIPIFVLMQQANFFILAIMQMTMAFFLGGINGVILLFLGDLFEKKIRCTAMSLSFTCASCVSGGIMPTLCNFMVGKYEILLFPAIAISIFSLLALFILHFSENLKIYRYSSPLNT